MYDHNLWAQLLIPWSTDPPHHTYCHCSSDKSWCLWLHFQMYKNSPMSHLNQYSYLLCYCTYIRVGRTLLTLLICRSYLHMLISEHWKVSWHWKSLCCDCDIVFIIKTLTMYKGGRPQNSVWEHFCHVTVKHFFSCHHFLPCNSPMMRQRSTQLIDGRPSNRMDCQLTLLH